jgi:osmotically-inducible protein OsmY
MRPSKRRTLGLLLAGLLSASWARAGDAEDVALTVAVRAALNRDDRLGSLGLGAAAADGNVTIWGPVPSADLVTLAEFRAGRIAGVKTITNETHVPPKGVVEFARKPGLKPTDIPQPIVLMPLPESPIRIVRADPEDERPAAPAIVKPEDARRTVAKETAPEILAPNGMTRASSTPVRPAATRSDLTEKIESFLDRNANYDGINVVIQSGLVRLNGTLKDWNDLWPLTEELSKLPGVKRVVVDKIAILTGR